MNSKRRTARSGLQAVENAVEVVSLVTGDRYVSPRGLGSLIVIMGIAIVGVAIWFGAFFVALVIVVVFGLAQGPYTWLAGALGYVGFFGGLAAAAIVMFRIVRRHRRLVAFSGFGDAAEDEGHASTSVAGLVGRRPTSAEELRALDSRLAEAPPATKHHDSSGT